MRARLVRGADAAAAPLAVALIVALLVVLGLDQGGYYPATFTSAASVAFLGLGLLLLAPTPRAAIARRGLIAFAVLALLAAWTGLSGLWSPVPDTPRTDMERTMLYVGLFGLGLVAATGRRQARRLVWALLGVIVVLVGAGLLSRLAPALLVDDAPRLLKERLSFPFGYWNGLGALAASGATLALGLAADVRARPAPRALAAGAVTLLLVALYLSLSRGAWLGFAIGVTVLLALAPRRGAVAIAIAIASAGTAVAVLALQSHPPLLDGRLVPGAHAAAFARELVALVLLAAGAQWLSARLGRTRQAPVSLRPRVAVALLGLVVVGALAVGVAQPPARAAADRTPAWMERQVHEFLKPSSVSREGQARLLTVQGSRSDAYRVALAGFAAQPLRGEGAGSFEPRYARTRAVTGTMRDAHSLPLATLTELGLVGLALLSAFLAIIAFAAVRGRRRGGGQRRAHVAAVSAAAACWLAHAGIDWAWEIPALTGTILVLCATLFAGGGRRTAPAPA